MIYLGIHTHVRTHTCTRSDIYDCYKCRHETWTWSRLCLQMPLHLTAPSHLQTQPWLQIFDFAKVLWLRSLNTVRAHDDDMTWKRFLHYQSIDDDVIKWKHFPRYWPFVRGNHRSPVNSPHKGQWHEAFDVFFELRPNKRLSKQWWDWWFETPSCPLWCHCNGAPWFLHHCNLIICSTIVRVNNNVAPKLHITDPLWGKSTDDKRVPIIHIRHMHWRMLHSSHHFFLSVPAKSYIS